MTKGQADLLLTLDAALPRRSAIEHALRDAIVDGRLAPGAPLPSTRALAGELGVARGTVVAAFEQLGSEGLITARPGGATRVAHVPPPPPEPTPRPRATTAPQVRADFAGGDPDLSRFPRAAWRKAVTAVLAGADDSRFGYGDPMGESELRVALAEYLGRTRGVVASPDHVLITAGFTHSLAVLGRALVAAGHRSVTVEDPSYWRHRVLLAAAGLRCVPVAVDDDGLRVDDLVRNGTRAALTSPTHHTPLGVSLSASRRSALARWVAADDRVVLEDDYDGELRFDRRPLRALQALDPARVVYCGSASKALAPGLRLSWCVIPPNLLTPALAAQASMGGQPVSRLEQLAFAHLLSSGGYDAQVRRVRADYRTRRDELVAALATHLPHVRVEGVAAGLKAVLRLPAGADEARVVEGLATRGVAVVGLGAFRVEDATSPSDPADRPALVVNYARPFRHAYRGALALLVESLADLVPQPT